MSTELSAAPAFVVGVDFGQTHDYSAWSVIQFDGGRPGDARHGSLGHQVRHLERVRGVSYPLIVDRVCQLLRTPPLAGNAMLVCDQTGVGRPIVDLIRQAKVWPIAVTITSGNAVVHDGRDYRVPKRDLVGTVQVLLQGRRLRVAEGMAESKLLTAELQDFRIRFTAAANDTYGTWRENAHDDLVLATALACWWGEHCPARVRFY